MSPTDGTGRVHTTPAGRRFQILGDGEASDGDVEVLAAAIDRYATQLAEQQLGPWTTARRLGIGTRAWEPGKRWAATDRAGWGQLP